MIMGLGRLGQTAVVEVGDDADDRFNPVPVLDVLSYGIFVGPEFPGEGLIDEIYSGRVGDVVFREVASTQNRDPEQVQVTRRDAHPLASAAVLIDRTPDDLEPRGIFDVDGPPKACGRKFHSRQGIEPVASIPQELSHAGRILVAWAVERHLHGQNIVRIEARTHLVERDEGANEQAPRRSAAPGPARFR